MPTLPDLHGLKITTILHFSLSYSPLTQQAKVPNAILCKTCVDHKANANEKRKLSCSPFNNNPLEDEIIVLNLVTALEEI